MTEQITKLRKILKQDQVIFLNTKQTDQTDNIYYLTNLEIDAGILIITKKTQTLYIPGFEYDRIKNKTKIKVKPLDKPLKELLKQLKGKIAYDGNELTANQLKLIKNNIDISKELQKLKQTKTKYEIKKLKKAANITTKIFNKLLKQKNLNHEGQIKQFLLQETLKNKATPAFPPIVASGNNASLPHYQKEQKLKKGFCIIDYGVRYKGYRADVTRTIYIGNPTKEDINLYNKVKEIQKECIKLYKKNNIIEIPYIKAKKQLKENLTHSLGHGVGLDIHESPNITINNKEKFKNNMIVTCEPGFYNKSKGIRIEDDILINNNNPIILTKTTKKLISWK